MAKILLTKLQCIVNDEIDEDEVYLKYNGEKIWPTHGLYTSIDNSETFELNVELSHTDRQKPLVIELWDFDYLSTNDFLGTFEMILGDDYEGSFSTSMKIKETGTTASYILFWKIIE